MINPGHHLGVDGMVLSVIDPVRGSTCHEIAERLGYPNNVIGKALGRLHDAGKIQHLASKRKGEYLVKLGAASR